MGEAIVRWSSLTERASALLQAPERDAATS
jgi:hypothetical protein